MSDSVGVIGLGNIGGHVATVLLDAYDVVVFDIDPIPMEALEGKGATVANSAKEVAEQADIVLLSLPSNSALEAAALGDDGAVKGLSPGDILIDTSTVSPVVSTRVADACEEIGAGYLDAPVSGGARNAEKGTLTILVGGLEDTLERVRPVLETIGETIHHVGPTGTGVTLKVINNYMLGMNQLVLSEALTMARSAGIADETFAETVSDSSGASYALDRNMERFIIPDEYDSEFTLSLMRKDVALAEGFATENDVPRLLTGASGLYRIAEAMGYGDLDAAAVLKLYETLQNGN